MVERWAPREKTTVGTLAKGAVVKLAFDAELRRVEKTGTSGAKLCFLQGAPDPIYVPNTLLVTRYAYVREEV